MNSWLSGSQSSSNRNLLIDAVPPEMFPVVIVAVTV